MDDLTYDRSLGYARAADRATLRTVTGRAFAVGVYRHGCCFIPASSGRGQSDGRRAPERSLERYNAIGSPRPGDYGDGTRNAFYLLGLTYSAASR